MWYLKEVKIRPSKFKLLRKGPYIVRKVLRNNMVLLGNMDEEFLLLNAHKLKPYLVSKEQHGEVLTTQEDNKGSNYQVNWIAHFNKDHFSKVVIYFIGAIMVSYISPPSAPQPNRPLPNQNPLILILVMKDLY
jgi:hypothetical protein